MGRGELYKPTNEIFVSCRPIHFLAHKETNNRFCETP